EKTHGLRRAELLQHLNRPQPTQQRRRTNDPRSRQQSLDAAANFERRLFLQRLTQQRIGWVADLLQFLSSGLADGELAAVEIRQQSADASRIDGLDRLQPFLQQA